MKQYEVEVKSQRHGKYGCTTYFGLVLSCGSKEAAKDFAWEIVSKMTMGEFHKRCINENENPFVWHNPEEKVGEYANIFIYTASRFIG